MKSIFDYIDYKKFLVDSFVKKRARNNHFSLGVWSKTLSLDSSSTLSKILNGKRHPGPLVAKKLSLYYNHNKDEEFFFFFTYKDARLFR